MEYNAEYNSQKKEIELLGDANVGGVKNLSGVKLKADGGTSDGYHTFDELYYHRTVLFSVICNQNKEKAWKSKLHHDGTMYDDYFVVGINTELGQYSYHYHVNYWDIFNVEELEKAPEFDGHKPSDIYRLITLY